MADLQVKLSVYNLLNQQRVTESTRSRWSTITGRRNEYYRLGTDYQSPRYGLLTFKLDF